MNRYLIDENLPRSLAPALRKLGFEAQDVREVGLRGQPDVSIYKYAQREHAVLISGDLGFADETEFPLEDHWGIISVRIPSEVSAKKRVQEILAAIQNLKDESLKNVLVVVSPGRVRTRRKPL
ncbi:DUF5615 family PIN-like protein [Candidatus Acetothermia bacterium]|nr:DUF5615 family PIN-like protein [Candidatus Acetothermia bacterium]